MWLYHEENVKNEPASNNKGAYEDLTFLVGSLLTIHVPVCFWPCNHNFRDIELKFCILS